MQLVIGLDTSIGAERYGPDHGARPLNLAVSQQLLDATRFRPIGLALDRARRGPSLPLDQGRALF
jgi:hypothetical protein